MSTTEPLRNAIIKAGVDRKIIEEGAQVNDVALLNVVACLGMGPRMNTAEALTVTPEMIAAAEAVDDLYRMGQPQLWAKVFRAMYAAMPSSASTNSAEQQPVSGSDQTFASMQAAFCKRWMHPINHSDYQLAMHNARFEGYRAGWEDRPIAHQYSQPVSALTDERRVDEIVSGLYRRFKDWSKRGFGPDDVTWCEVKADVTALLSATSQQAPASKCAGCEHCQQESDCQFAASHPAPAQTGEKKCQ